MIITYFEIIVFQLVERIAITKKSIKSVLGSIITSIIASEFSYNALPTRHEVHGKPYLQEEYNEPTKLLNIADMAN